MSPTHAEFSQWDASYVMGALTPGDRRAYEAHLEECERCRVAVAELASMPGLLARARPEVETWDGRGTTRSRRRALPRIWWTS